MSFRDQISSDPTVFLPSLLRSPGLPLDPEIRGLLESRFGQEFADVRVHTDDIAAAVAGTVGAQAFTAGNHIVFAAGRYNPGTRDGLWLLAHELAHVVQQKTQGSRSPGTSAHRARLLESEANRAADVIVTGQSLATSFVLGSAPVGLVQFHKDQECPGTPINDSSVDMTAVHAIEGVYRRDHLANAVFFGSQFSDSPNPGARMIAAKVPPGAPNAIFAEELLAMFYLQERQAWTMPAGSGRPDIIDFHRRVFYQFSRVGDLPYMTNFQTINYYNVANQLLVGLGSAVRGEPQWNQADANLWYPDHVLVYPTDALNRCVCTSRTDYDRHGSGVILYSVNDLNRRRKRTKPVTQYELTEFDEGFNELGKSLWAELPSEIQFYDPQNPNYVFIVPRHFYHEWYRQKNANEKTKRLWDKMRVKPSYDFPGGRAVKDMRGRLHDLSKLAAIGAAAGIIIVGGAMIIPAAAISLAPTAAEIAAVLEASATAAAEVYGPIQAIVVSARVAGPVAAMYTTSGATIGMTAGATAGATGGMLATAAPGIKTVVASAGVLMVILEGTASASAKNSPKATAIRAVAVDDFQPLESVQTAVSGGPPTRFSHNAETAKGKFKPGTLVLFDAVPHIVIGSFTVR